MQDMIEAGQRPSTGAWFSPSITSIAFRKRSLRSCRSGSGGMKEGGENVFGVGGMALVIVAASDLSG